MKSPLFRVVPLALATALVAACAGEDTPEDVIAQEESSVTIESAGDVSVVSELILGERPQIRGIPVAQVLPRIVARIRARVSEFGVPACMTVTTDDETFVEVTFEDCTGPRGLFGISGTLRAEVSYESEACTAGTCPVAVVYAIDTAGLTIGRRSITGSWELRDPVADGEPTTWSAALELEGPRRGATATAEGEFLRVGACVTYSVTSTIASGPRSRTASATDVSRCAGACPSSGTVTFTNGAGQSLGWTYDGDATVTVTGPNGNTREVILACGE